MCCAVQKGPKDPVPNNSQNQYVYVYVENTLFMMILESKKAVRIELS